MLVDPVHELPRAVFFIRDFLDLYVKEITFSRFDFTLEHFPIFQTSCCSIVVQYVIVFFIPPFLRMFHDFDTFAILIPCKIDS